MNIPVFIEILYYISLYHSMKVHITHLIRKKFWVYSYIEIIFWWFQIELQIESPYNFQEIWFYNNLLFLT